MNDATTYSVGDILRMPNYVTASGFRVWKIVGCHLGATGQEGTYELMPLELKGNKTINVPCIILETHREIERV